MKFFNIDLHISIIADMKNIFKHLGHEVIDKSLSDHTWVFNREKDSIPMLDNDRWRTLSPNQMSDEFYAEYKNTLSDYDGFIVTYPPTFSLLYKNFDQPVIINNPIRYEWPYSFHKQYWEQFNNYLRDRYDNGKLLLVANNLYDKKYMELFIQRPVSFIPSICTYYDDGEYLGDKDEFIYYSRNRITEFTTNKIVYKNDVFSTHTHGDLRHYKGIIHIPYQISYMSIFEQYSYNIPLFVPTKRLLLQIYKNRTYNVLKETSWNNYFSQISQSVIECNHEFDPNDYLNYDAVEYWLDYADFYDLEWMPYITYFDSFSELEDIVNNVDTNEISNKMRNFNTIRRKKVYEMWQTELRKIQT